MRLGERFAEAVAKAADWHEGQVRKGTNVPYISHLLIVAGIVVQAGGDEDEAIAALLHDAIEDAGATREEIEETFGERVAAIVWECTDATQEMKSEIPWRARKEGYIARLEATEDRGARYFLPTMRAPSISPLRQADRNVVGGTLSSR